MRDKSELRETMIKRLHFIQSIDTRHNTTSLLNGLEVTFAVLVIQGFLLIRCLCSSNKHPLHASMQMTRSKTHEEGKKYIRDPPVWEEDTNDLLPDQAKRPNDLNQPKVSVK